MNRVVVVEASLRGDFTSDLSVLARKVREEVERQNNEGYKVLSATNLISSAQEVMVDKNRPYVESFTTGILLIFEQAAD